MDNNTSKIISPFGPKILLSECPNFIINSLNDYTDKVCSDKKLRDKYSSFGKKGVPNLLQRNLENIYLSNDFFKLNEMINYLEFMGNLYLNEVDSVWKATGSKVESRIGKTKINEEYFPTCWVNRYFRSNYTQLHVHDSDLSGIIFLKIPKFLTQTDTNPENTFGHVFFSYGSENSFCKDLWNPEQKVGTVMIFPSWLRHVAYPTNSDEERRTFSFNLNIFQLKNNTKNMIQYH